MGSQSLSCSAEITENRGLFGDLLASLGFEWSERRDLNSRPPVPQTGALTGLRYAPCRALCGQSLHPSSTVTDRTHIFVYLARSGRSCSFSRRRLYRYCLFCGRALFFRWRWRRLRKSGIDPIFHDVAGLEDDNAARRNGDDLTRLGISSYALGLLTEPEGAERRKLYRLSPLQSVHDLL
jgi:hypothetical protein